MVYKKLLVSTRFMPGVDKISTQHEYDEALKVNDDLTKKIVKLGELNNLTYEDLLLPMLERLHLA